MTYRTAYTTSEARLNLSQYFGADAVEDIMQSAMDLDSGEVTIGSTNGYWVTVIADDTDSCWFITAEAKL